MSIVGPFIFITCNYRGDYIMPRDIYNEGRVVGYSAYEVYVREHLSETPDTNPATEREWLSASLASGASLLFKFPVSEESQKYKDDQDWMYQVELPSETRLGAANTIIGSFFKGSAETDITGWAVRVTDYGDLIVNDSSLVDTESSANNVSNWSTQNKQALVEYMKIVDGVVLQPGQWKDSGLSLPAKDLSPNISEKPVVRFHIRGPITHEFYILLTGFTIRTVLSGTAGLDGSTQTNMPADGDFLGPAVYPWANKIIFSIPTSYISYFVANSYKRQITGTVSQNQDSAPKVVKDTSVIDMKTSNPGTYYVTKNATSRQLVTVDEFTTLGDGTAVLTVYQRSNKYPAALWGTYVDSTGDNYLNPLDVVAPGTVKMFENASEKDLKDYEITFPGTTGMNKNGDGTVNILNSEGKVVPMAKVTHKSIVTTGGTNSGAQAVVTQTGNNKEISLSLGSGGSDSQYTISNLPTNTVVPSNSNLQWADMLAALVADKAIDILGNRLKSMKQTLTKAESNTSDQCPYIEFGPDAGKKRFYISSTEPKGDIPIGSIGIGWGIATD